MCLDVLIFFGFGVEKVEKVHAGSCGAESWRQEGFEWDDEELYMGGIAVQYKLCSIVRSFPNDTIYTDGIRILFFRSLSYFHRV